MPSLVAFNRQWNIGSDDFVFPEITEALVRISWVAFGVSVFVFHFPLACSTHNLTLHFLALLVINVITILLAIFTAVISARGTIMDSQPRRLLPRLLYIRLPIFIIEVALTILATVHAFRSTNGGEGCDFATIARVTIVLEWFLIATAIVGLFIVFHLTESDVEDGTTIAQKSWSRRMRIFKIGQDHSMRAALDDLAVLISSFFVDSDLVPSDVVAGLLLAYHSPNNQYPPVKEKEHENRPSWMNLKDAEYFLHHATCVYGWPTYILYNCGLKSIYRLFRKLQCCGRMRCAQLKMRILPTKMNLNTLKESKLLELSSHFVGGNHVEFVSNRQFPVMEPRSGRKLATWHYANAEQVDLVVKTAKNAQKTWAGSTWMERNEVLKKTAELLKTHCDDIAYWECLSNGKPISEAKADVLSCVDTFNFYSGIAHDLLGHHIPLDPTRYAYTRRLPIGVVAAIGAWNYPIQTCTWKTAPALACGNSIIYKPSPLSPVTALILGEILKTAGLPDGVFNVIQGDAETAQHLIHHDDVTKVSFTGSIPTGKTIMAACAERNIKPVTMELGGKSALIVFEDADVDSGVACAMMANFYSQGQVCSNASKVLVHKGVLKEFLEKLVKKTKELKIGDPLKDETQVGAHISEVHRTRVEGYINGAINEGATKICGGDRIQVPGLENGYYLSPCILTDITPNMTVYKEEIFGAVLLIIPFDTEEEAVGIANDTDMGLAAGLVTKDLAKSYRISEQLNAGNVYVNTFNDVSPLVPFGGIGESGFGRENGVAVLEHYTQLKSVFVNTGACPNPF